ncbi:MAG: DUF106 domain-containing protein [Candidatus Aenigmarchaeota archaeon]|nr:DUF106 domain-containing protein [Candidatus Aenigmarchaeota archaeon]
MSILGLSAAIEEFLLVALILFGSSLIYKFLLDHEKLKEIKSKQKEKQERLKEIQKTNPDEANQVMNEMLKLSQNQMKLTMKPMIVSLIVFMLVLPIMPQLFPDSVVNLPFTLPYFGSDFGWMAWYFILSLPLNSIFRKILGVEL